MLDGADLDEFVEGSASVLVTNATGSRGHGVTGRDGPLAVEIQRPARFVPGEISQTEGIFSVPSQHCFGSVMI